MRVRLALSGLCLLAPAILGAQETRRCLFQVSFVGDSGRKVDSPDGINYFAGGGVVITCRGTAIVMKSDSVAAYGGRIVQFIANVSFKDSSVTLTADNGTYFKDGERWEARGNVKTTNLKTGSSLTGPSLDYFRAVKGIRDTVEVFAPGRPTITYVTKDGAGVAQEPYIIVGDRVRMKGEDQVWAGGTVTVDRSDLQTRSDSLLLRTGKAGAGTLLGGSPSLKAMGKDSLDLTGKRIDFTLDDKDLTAVQSSDSAHAVTRDLDLAADTIAIDLKDDKVELTQAWGKARKAVAITTEYELRADSLVVESPGQALKEVRGFGAAWAGFKPDSGSTERDWISGDSLVIRFAKAPADSADSARTRVVAVEARGTAKSFYRVTDKQKQDAKPGLNYARADRILISMRTAGEEGVERVDFFGHVDGIQLEADSTAGRQKPAMPKPPTTFTRPTLPTLPGLPGGQSGAP